MAEITITIKSEKQSELAEIMLKVLDLQITGTEADIKVNGANIQDAPKPTPDLGEWSMEARDMPVAVERPTTESIHGRTGINKLGLPRRTLGSLYWNTKIRTVAQLCAHSAEELLRYRHVGDWSIWKIRFALCAVGRSLKGE